MEIINKESTELQFAVPEKDRFFVADSPFTPINIEEIKVQIDDEFGKVRLYNHYVGDPSKNENGFTLQIRAFQKLTSTTKKRNIIASVKLSDSEILDMARFVIENRKKYGTYCKNPEL